MRQGTTLALLHDRRGNLFRMFRGKFELCCLAMLASACTQTLDFDEVSSKQNVGSDPGSELLLPNGWVADASHSLPAAPPSYAIDGTTATAWTTGAPQLPGMWWSVDFGATLSFRTIHVDARAERQDACEKLDVYTSDDGTTWNRVLANVPGDPELTIDLMKPVSSRGLKLQLPADVTKDRWWRIDELQLLK